MVYVYVGKYPLLHIQVLNSINAHSAYFVIIPLTELSPYLVIIPLIENSGACFCKFCPLMYILLTW